MSTTTRQAKLKIRTVHLEPGERIVVLKPGQQALVFEEAAHYRLGEPLDDVVGGHVLDQVERVTWCSGRQSWVATGHMVRPLGIE